MREWGQFPEFFNEHRAFSSVLGAFNKEPIANANHFAAWPHAAHRLPHKFSGSLHLSKALGNALTLFCHEFFTPEPFGPSLLDARN